MSRKKDLEIGFGNPHQSVETMRDQKPLIDPPPNGTGAHSDDSATSSIVKSFAGDFERSDFISPTIRLTACRAV
jgi:hypothetical protein